MTFAKGKTRHPESGRKKGTPNKTTADVRAMILQALDSAGGAEYLQRQAEENPAAFMQLVGKVVPKELNIDGQLAIGSAIIDRISRAVRRV